MNKFKKYFFLIGMVCFLGTTVTAQEKSQDEGSAIVMSKDQMQSFIKKIATLKKEQINYQQKEKSLHALEAEVNRQMGYQNALSNTSSTTYSGASSNPEIAAINARLDRLQDMLEQLAAGRPTSSQGYYGAGNEPVGIHIYIDRPGASPNTLDDSYNRQGFAEPYSETAGLQRDVAASTQQPAMRAPLTVQEPAQKGPPHVTVVRPRNQRVYLDRQQQPVHQQQPVYVDGQRYQAAQSPDIFADKNNRSDRVRRNEREDKASAMQDMGIRNKIDTLERQINLLNDLRSGAAEGNQQEYLDDINALKAQVAALSADLTSSQARRNSLQSAREAADEGKQESEALTGNVLNVYFANNSTRIPAGDYAQLKEIIRSVRNNPGLLVLLRGFSSSVGNRSYNEKLAAQRANSVKTWLVNNGISPRYIVTQAQGEDRSESPEMARRVEVTLLRK